MNKTEKGRIGENIAAAYLMRSGFNIYCRNYRYGKSETDIIARDGDTVVFVEVKARYGADFGSGAEAVTEKKRRMLSEGAVGYCSENSLLDEKVRFDVVEVDLKSMSVTSHIKDAFECCID